MKEITKKSVEHAIKIIKLYEQQNERMFPEDTIIHEINCELGMAHGRCYCTRHRETTLNYQLNNILLVRRELN